MEDEPDFMKAPQANLQTWRGVTRLITISCVLIAILLIVMAGTLTP